MSREGWIRAEHVWKGFHPDRGRPLLRDHIELIRSRLANKVEKGWKWALRDVDLVAGPGDAVGLIGRNGSGKTTFLKVLTRVMYPEAGGVSVSGRVGALIEVRAGIHADLTGRENIFLFGSILGLSRREVAERFDQIVEFAEIGQAIDRQVKFYSSGMQMRLGFAVAAFLEPDVLLVDEVLAVGDSSFQQKCLDRMREVLAQGTTLVFVSHDLAAVESVCRTGIWLNEGVVQQEGPIQDVLAGYRAAVQEGALISRNGHGPINLDKAWVTGPGGDAPRSHDALSIGVAMTSDGPRSGGIWIGVSQGTATPIFLVQRSIHFESGETILTCEIPNLPLPQGHFALWVGVFDKTGREYLSWRPAAQFDVFGPRLDPAPVGVLRLAPVQVAADWNVSTT
jgi:ABC-type polysaccharide/polyol phosphate transport system ATPase subunit